MCPFSMLRRYVAMHACIIYQHVRTLAHMRTPPTLLSFRSPLFYMTPQRLATRVHEHSPAWTQSSINCSTIGHTASTHHKARCCYGRRCSRCCSGATHGRKAQRTERRSGDSEGHGCMRMQSVCLFFHTQLFTTLVTIFVRSVSMSTFSQLQLVLLGSVAKERYMYIVAPTSVQASLATPARLPLAQVPSY